MHSKPGNSVGSQQDFSTWGLLVQSTAGPYFFKKIDDSYCARVYSSLTDDHCFDLGYVEKQPAAWREYQSEHVSYLARHHVTLF